MKKIIGTLSVILALMSGCSPGTQEITYPAIVKFNGEEYYAHGAVENNEFTVKEKIGEVRKRVDVDKELKEEWSSNSFDVGTEIYSSNEKENVFLFKDYDGVYRTLTKEAKDLEQ